MRFVKFFAIAATTAALVALAANGQPPPGGPKGDKKGDTNYVYPVKAPPELQANVPSPLVGDPVLEKALKRTGEWADSVMSRAAATCAGLAMSAAMVVVIREVPSWSVN